MKRKGQKRSFEQIIPFLLCLKLSPYLTNTEMLQQNLNVVVQK